MKKGDGERLLHAGRTAEIVGRSFVSDTTAVSKDLVTKVANTAALLHVSFADAQDLADFHARRTRRRQKYCLPALN